MPPQLLHEHVSGRRQQHSKLIRPEPGATRPVNLQPVVKFLDPVLDIAALTVDVFVEALWPIREIRDDKPRIVLRLAPFQANHFGFDNDPALSVPAPGPIPAFPVDMFRLTALAGLSARLSHELLATAAQHAVSAHRDDIVHFGCFEKFQNLWRRKATIQPDQDPCVRESFDQPFEKPLENPDSPQRCRSVARAKDVGEEVLFRCIIEFQEACDRKVAPGVVMTIEEGELLAAMRSEEHTSELQSPYDLVCR